MRIVLVHGINNEESTREAIETQWLSAIRGGWEAAGLAAKPLTDVTTVYYAQDLAAAATATSQAVAMGGPAAGQRAEVAYAFLKEYQDAAGISDDEIAAAAARNGVPTVAVGMGPPHEGWVIALAVGLEALLPTRGKYVAGIFLRQAAVYLDDRAVTLKIDSIVRKQIFPEGDDRPMVVLAHSLGTVVSYRLFTEKARPDLNIPLFVTMGSPLGIQIVKKRLAQLDSFPKPPMERWMNVVCKDDFVTLNKRLGVQHLGYDGVEHIGDVPNDGPDKHAIGPYLSASAVARAIHAVL